MNPGSFWLRVLNVYSHEWGIVKRLYIFQFFQGAGIAFFFTSALAQFLERFPITELPWVMIFSASLLWIVGLLYTRLEHAITFKKFNVVIILVMTTSVLVLWGANYQFEQDWFCYLILAWFNVLYLLNNLQFWGIAAVLFDLRQSKRLFAVISAGDIPAKAIGYSLALVIVPYTGAANLLLLGAFCMLASLPFFYGILKSGNLEVHHAAHRKHHGKKHIRNLVKNIASNTYIRRIAFISLITSTCVILINYGFYGEVSKANKDDVALAKFIAFFYASLRIIAFITKMVFSSRLTASLGIRQALFITPLGMLLLSVIIITAGNLAPSEKLIFYLFGVCSMIVDVLRTSFNSPVLLTLMQPLPTYERLRAHNIVKGIMDPFASFFAGGFLLIIFYLHGKVDLMFLCYVLVVLGILWLIGVALVNKQYLQILVKTISNRYFSREEFDLNDDTIKEQIRNKMMTGSDLEVISILRMLKSKNDHASEELIEQLIYHPSQQVQLEALKIISHKSPHEIREKLETLIAGNIKGEVSYEAVKTFCKIGNLDWGLHIYYENADEQIREAAITGLLSNKNEEIKRLGELAVKHLVNSTGKADKLKVITILDRVKDEYDHPDHQLLITDPDPQVRQAAIKAVGKASSLQTIGELINQLANHEKIVLNSLLNVGNLSIPLLKEQIINKKTSNHVREKLITLCGRIGDDEAIKVLLELLIKQPQNSAAIVKALHRSKYSAGQDKQKLLESIARLYILHGVELLHMQQALIKKDASYSVLNNSLQQEIHEIREVLLSVFGCLYDREKINQVKYGLNAQHKDSIANAMEIIELTVKKDIGKQFNLMFEAIEVEQRCISLRSLFTEKQFEKIEHILGRILSEKPIHYYDWTKACSMYVSKKYEYNVDKKLYNKFLQSENKLLKETALYASATA